MFGSPGGVMNSAVNGPNHNRLTDVINTQRMNAMAYVHSVMNPWEGGGVRIPELFGPGSTTSSPLARESIVSVQDSGNSVYVGAMCIKPNLKRFTSVVSASANYTWTWLDSNHPELTNMSNVASLYRVVSLGVRIIPTTKATDRNGTLIVAPAPWVGAGAGDFSQGPSTSMWTYISQSSYGVAYDPAEMGPEGVFATWTPMTLDSVLNPTSNMTSTGVGWRDPDNDNVQDNVIYLVWYGMSSMLFDVELTLNIEFIPWMEDAYLFTLAYAPAGHEDIVTAAGVEDIGFERVALPEPPDQPDPFIPNSSRLASTNPAHVVTIRGQVPMVHKNLTSFWDTIKKGARWLWNKRKAISQIVHYATGFPDLSALGVKNPGARRFRARMISYYPELAQVTLPPNYAMQDVYEAMSKLVDDYVVHDDEDEKTPSKGASSIFRRRRD